MVSRKCLACGSTRFAHGHLSVEFWPWRVGFFRFLGGFLPWGGSGTRVDAVACSNCGNVQFFARDLSAVQRAHEGERRHALQLPAAGGTQAR
jgi:predicted nucleic-acid-binding Zn-ribbon protein